jgi:tetratricopeptide (TPR) repeat protein
MSRDIVLTLAIPTSSILHESKLQLNVALRNARRPERFAAALQRPRELSRIYPSHRFAAKTLELSAYSLLLQHRLAEATRQYVVAMGLALTAGDAMTVAVTANALSNIYLTAGNIPGALEAAQQAVASVPPLCEPAFRASLQSHYARVLARSGKFEEAERTFGAAIELSERESLGGPRADAWKLMGRELMLRGDLDAAGRALTEAIRLRLLNRDPEMASDYHDLADIRMRAGQPAEALRILDLAERRIATATCFPAWRSICCAAARAWLSASRGWLCWTCAAPFAASIPLPPSSCPATCYGPKSRGPPKPTSCLPKPP